MKAERHLAGGLLLFLAVAAVFVAIDLFGLWPARRYDLSFVPAMVAQVLSLTLVVGTWIFAMVFLEREADVGPGRTAPPWSRRDRPGTAGA
jgi:hypothetical protein